MRARASGRGGGGERETTGVAGGKRPGDEVGGDEGVLEGEGPLDASSLSIESGRVVGSAIASV